MLDRSVRHNSTLRNLTYEPLIIHAFFYSADLLNEIQVLAGTGNKFCIFIERPQALFAAIFTLLTFNIEKKLN